LGEKARGRPTIGKGCLDIHNKQHVRRTKRTGLKDSKKRKTGKTWLMLFEQKVREEKRKRKRVQFYVLHIYLEEEGKRFKAGEERPRKWTLSNRPMTFEIVRILVEGRIHRKNGNGKAEILRVKTEKRRGQEENDPRIV